MSTEHWHQKLKLMCKQKRALGREQSGTTSSVLLTNPNHHHHHLIPLPRLHKSQFLSIFHYLWKNKTAWGTFFQRNQSQLPPKGLLCNRVIRAIFRLPQFLLHSINIKKLAQSLPQQQSVPWCMNRLRGCQQNLHYNWSHSLLFFAPFT